MIGIITVSISENELNHHLPSTPAAWELYDFLISCMLRQLSYLTHACTSVICMCVCRSARANEYMKDCYYIRANIICARKTRSRTSQSFTYAPWSTKASELPRSWEKKRKMNKKQGERRLPQRRSLPICSILLSKWAIVRYALPKWQVCPPRRAMKEKFLFWVAALFVLCLRFPFAHDH